MLSILDLPVKILLNIFELLDARSRSRVAATCKSWKYLTDDFLRWQLNVTSSFDSECCKELMISERKFSTIRITEQVCFTALWNCMSRSDITVAVTGMTIEFASMRLTDFNRMLEMFPNLKDLRLNSVTLSPTDDSNEQSMKLPDLAHLRTLFFGGDTDERLLQYLAKAKLTTFVCREQKFTNISDFLTNQADLKELEIRRSSTQSPFPVGSVTFSLKKLFFDFESMGKFGILHLVFKHSRTIETLTLEHISQPIFYTIVLSLVRNFTTLHVIMPIINVGPDSAVRLPKLNSVTELKMYDCGYQRAGIDELSIKFIECVPNLEILDLGIPYKLLHFESIVKNLKKLKILKMMVVSLSTTLNNLKCPPVEKLRIKRIGFGKFVTLRPLDSMVPTTAVCPTVSSLSYNGYTNDEVLEVIRIMFPMLKHLDVERTMLKAKHTNVVAAGFNVRHREEDFFL